MNFSSDGKGRIFPHTKKPTRRGFISLQFLKMNYASRAAQLENVISGYLPRQTAPHVVEWILEHKIILTITGPRQSVFGDYRRPEGRKNHRISVNGDLNQYAFLITLLHELAHMHTWLQHGDRVNSHGAEWKNYYRNLLGSWLGKKVFPPELETVLIAHLHRAPASSCTDQHLHKALLQYNKKPSIILEQIPLHEQFRLHDGKIFTKDKKRRTRFLCTETSTGKEYLISGVAEVERIL